MNEQLEALKTAFTTAHLNYVYNLFPGDENAPSAPYVCCVVTGGEGFHADDINFQNKMRLELSLFTTTKDPSLEDTVMSIFDDMEIGYSWTENYITDEKIYQITYSFEMEI